MGVADSMVPMAPLRAVKASSVLRHATYIGPVRRAALNRQMLLAPPPGAGNSFGHAARLGVQVSFLATQCRGGARDECAHQHG
jgi:hypothetical protein